MSRMNTKGHSARQGLAAAVTVVTVAVAVVVMGFAAAVPVEAQNTGLKVHAYTLKHQRTADAVALIRPLLSPQGTVEEHPVGNTLVLRDTREAIARLMPILEAFDHPPEDLRFEIQVVRAGPRRSRISPPLPPDQLPQSTQQLSPELVGRLRGLLRYDDYQVLSSAALSSKEGEEVTYSLGKSYSVTFTPGATIDSQRVKLEGFRILKHSKNPTNKGRQLGPRELFHASLNLQVDRLFTLVLAQDSTQEEALMVAISCRREGDER